MFNYWIVAKNNRFTNKFDNYQIMQIRDLKVKLRMIL